MLEGEKAAGVDRCEVAIGVIWREHPRVVIIREIAAPIGETAIEVEPLTLRTDVGDGQRARVRVWRDRLELTHRVAVVMRPRFLQRETIAFRFAPTRVDHLPDAEIGVE